jgi:penicillin amidase
MTFSSADLLARLGRGESIDSICHSTGLARDEFNDWWRRECASRVPPSGGTTRGAIATTVRIERDEWGLPHVFAGNDEDLFFGFGYATAQDRLFQLDYLRRRALGRLSEVLGSEALELDLTARTVGLHRIAEAEWESLPDESRRLVAAYSRGVNALIDDCRSNLPVEFALLDYAPDPWRPQDCLAITGEFRWYLTGRFPVIAIPELARRTLGAGALYEAFLQAEADAEAILPQGSYRPGKPAAGGVGRAGGDPHEGHGSNNWVISGTKAPGGMPILASDPHIAFAAVSCWHEIRLKGGSFNVAGIAYAGMPAILFGRNDRVTWGITNNICSLRDLYQERTDPDHPGCFLHDGRWEPARETLETIHVKGGDPVRKTIRSSRNGPIVDEILPEPARETGPVSLKWLGASTCGWITAQLQMNRAKTCEELRRATEPWLVPTFCVVYADIFGHIGYQCTGRIPIREIWERGYRPGWDPKHQWAGLIPFEGMPHCDDPARGWIGTANNRVAADDFPYPLSGTWSSGHRALRIRQMLEGQPRFRRQDFARMHQDSVSVRAIDCVPALLEVLERAEPPATGVENRNSTASASNRGDHQKSFSKALQFHHAIEHLAVWDCRMEPDRVAASIFNVFFARWCERVAQERFPPAEAAFVAGAIGGLAGELLRGDARGWFRGGRGTLRDPRAAAIVEVFFDTLQFLTEKFGPELIDWGWGRLHTLEQKHFLSGRGDLGQLLDRGGVCVRGDYITVCNTGQSPDFTAPSGAGYRLIVDLADPDAGLWAIDAGSESGHPGSPHYDDQLPEWRAARYHYVALNREGTPPSAESILLIHPADSS